MKRVIYPGTFDPFTKGHLHILEKARKLFDEVIVVIMDNPSKKTMFSLEERISFIESNIIGITNVRIVSASGLTVQFAKDVQACAMIRGVRSLKDYEYEVELANVNQLLSNEIETLLFISDASYAHISSSNVKTIAQYHGDVSAFVNQTVAHALYAHFKKGVKK